ncbi:MAG TPA: ATP-binding cassette domain-containing protein [Balneolales bacterium]|nr:ATP-binding cassette domain-containing protein [Balneolales bacterium]
MIELCKITKSYGSTTAVDDISLSIHKNETFGLIGTSGSGKTTTLKMINRLIEPTSGSIIYNGQDITKLDPVRIRRQIGYVIQDTGLFPHYTIEENIAVVPKLLNWNNEKISKRVHFLLRLVGLPPDDFKNRYPHELSGGQQQRIGLARALAADPPLILLDEPFGALDPITRHQIRKEFKELEKQIQKTMVLVTHDVFEAFDLCDRIALLDQGKLQQIGTPFDLIFKPANAFCKDFFQANRFQLELSILSLKDLFPHLHNVVDLKHCDYTFSLQASLLEVFQSLKNIDEATCIQIIDHKEETIGYFSAQDVIRSFYDLKRRFSNTRMAK